MAEVSFSHFKECIRLTLCQVGVACSMASAGFAACLGASPAIIENAAEIGIEHNLGVSVAAVYVVARKY